MEIPLRALQYHPRTTAVVDEPAAATLVNLEHCRWIDCNKLDWQKN